MSAFSASWTEPVVEDWESGDFVRTDKLRDQVFQVLMHFATVHNHDGGTADGGFLPVTDPKYIMYISAAAGS